MADDKKNKSTKTAKTSTAKKTKAAASAEKPAVAKKTAPPEKATAKKSAGRKTTKKTAAAAAATSVADSRSELERTWGPVLNGPIREVGEIAIAAADVALEGGETPITLYFKDYLAAAPNMQAAHALSERFDLADANAPWVRGRAESAFNVPVKVEDERPRGTCFEGSFVAVLPSGKNGMLSVPFVCTDEEGDAGLRFGDPTPAEEICEKVGNAFWGILLEKPDELSEFTDRMYEAASGEWVGFGVQGGEPYMETGGAIPGEDEDYDEDDRPALKMTDEELEADDEDVEADEFEEPGAAAYDDDDETPASKRAVDDDDDGDYDGYGDEEEDEDEEEDYDDDDDDDDDDDPPYGFNLDDEDEW